MKNVILILSVFALSSTAFADWRCDFLAKETEQGEFELKDSKILKSEKEPITFYSDELIYMGCSRVSKTHQIPQGVVTSRIVCGINGRTYTEKSEAFWAQNARIEVQKTYLNKEYKILCESLALFEETK